MRCTTPNNPACTPNRRKKGKKTHTASTLRYRPTPKKWTGSSSSSRPRSSWPAWCSSPASTPVMRAAAAARCRQSWWRSPARASGRTGCRCTRRRCATPAAAPSPTWRWTARASTPPCPSTRRSSRRSAAGCASSTAAPRLRRGRASPSATPGATSSGSGRSRPPWRARASSYGSTGNVLYGVLYRICGNKWQSYALVRCPWHQRFLKDWWNHCFLFI